MDKCNKVEPAREVDHILERMETLATKAEDLRKKTEDRLSRISCLHPVGEVMDCPPFSSASAPTFDQMANMLNRINYNIEETMSAINRTEV